jgi:hypothetical protein
MGPPSVSHYSTLRAPHHPLPDAGLWYTLDPACYAYTHSPSSAARGSTAFVRAHHVLHEIIFDGDVLRADIKLKPLDSNERSLPAGTACFDYVRVLAQNATHRVLPQVHASPHGYTVSVWLPRETAHVWNVSASLLWVNFDMEGWYNSSEWSLHDESGCLPFPIEQPDVLNLGLSNYLPVGGDRNNSIGRSRARCAREDLAMGIARYRGATIYDWTPLRCRIHSEYTTKISRTPRDYTRYTRAAIQGKWILFIGASTLLEIFSHVVGLATQGKPFQYGRYPGTIRAAQEHVFNTAAGSCRLENYRTRDFDTGRSLAHLLPNHTRLTTMYDGHLYVCGSGLGLRSIVEDDGGPTQRGAWIRQVLSGGNATDNVARSHFIDSPSHYGRMSAQQHREERARRAAIVRNLDDSGASYGWPRGPDVVVFNSGIHDLNNGFSLSNWTRRLRSVWGLITSASDAPRRPHYIWMTIGGTYHRASKKMASHKLATGNCRHEVINGTLYKRNYTHAPPAMHLMNRIATDIALEYGASILDQEMLRELSPYDGDELHCIKGVVCSGTVDSLLKLIELGPAAP